MSEIKTFKIEQKFKSTEGLYSYLRKNVELISEAIGIQIKRPLKERLFCLTGKEMITERNILFFASKSDFLSRLGELIIMAGALEVDVIVFLMPEVYKAHLEPISWLQSICNEDTQFIVGEVSF